MTTLTEFLLARIAEDQEIAQDYLRWVLDNPPVVHEGSWVILPHEVEGNPFDPARVLAECEAKRRIVEVASAAERTMDAWTVERLKTDATSIMPDWTRRDAHHFTLYTIATPYADHPDFDEAWRA